LEADADGNVELGQLRDGLHIGLGIGGTLADFQAFGITAYDSSQKGIELKRNRCVPPTASFCFTRRYVFGEVSDSTRRFFNLYTMSGKQALEHGISTGIRGGDTNMPPDAIDCRGRYPCEARFNQFFGNSGDSNGRFYLKNMMRTVCLARQFGDRGGEHSYAASTSSLPGNFTLEPVPGREWQMRGAISATLFAFGKRDSAGELYLTMSDLRALFMDGRYPDGWQRREHGCLVSGCEMSAITRFNLDFECEIGYEDVFWQGSGCQVFTGKTCGSCNAGETCLSGKCICSRGANLRTMCFRNGACREQAADGYSWFGAPRVVVPADNPDAPGNP
jgi:hypothetical protein